MSSSDYGSHLVADDFVHINVSGMPFTTQKQTLKQFSGTLLGDELRLNKHYVECLKAYYFDRHQGCFQSILYYYQSGGFLIRPTDIPMDLFAKEVKYFGISDEVLMNLQRVEGYVPICLENDEERPMPSNNLLKRLWKLMEYPEGNFFGRLITLLSVLMIFMSIVTFCLESLPSYHSNLYATDNYKLNCTRNATLVSNHTTICNESSSSRAIDLIELITVIWFTAEYVLRIVSSPNKIHFLKTFTNIIDLVAILPYYIVAVVQKYSHASSFSIVRVVRLIRVLRVFKLSRHSMGLQILGNTLMSSLNELGMIVFVLGFCIIIFSSAIFYAEQETGAKDTGFTSIPDVFWYCLVTMTTVGYGDLVPMTTLGKMVGGLCAISGVVMIAMVVPVVVTNFQFFYKRDTITNAYRERQLLSVREAVDPYSLFNISDIPRPPRRPTSVSYHTSV